jgi:putative peptidoglycan lipid II flippase
MVGGLTLISRILGFIRDVVIASHFGAGATTDAFLVAFKIPNFMRRLFAEGAFSQAFIPVLSEYKTQREKAEVKQLIDHVSGNLGGVLLLVTVIGVLFAPIMVLIFAPGFYAQPEKYQMTAAMLQITFPYLLLIALTAFAGSVLNTYGRFAIPALTPVLLNLSMIGATLWLAPHLELPIMALAWSVLLAGVLQLAFQLPFLARLQLFPKPRFEWGHEGVKRIYRLMLPALFGVSVTQINLMVDTLMASFLVTGSVSWLYYSDRLMEFPVGVFGLALATVTLPNLSKTVAKGDFQTYSKTLDWALRWVFLVCIPATFGMIALATPILSTLFHRGQFSEHDVIMTTRSLIAYTIGLLGFVAVKVLASGFYSRQDTRTPVRIGVIAMLTNIVLNLTLILPLQHAGLAFSTSVAALLNAWLLYHNLRKDGVFQPQAGWRNLLLRIFLASLCMGVILWWGSGLSHWLNLRLMERGFYLLGWLVAGMVIYVLSLIAMGFRWRQVSLE